jgi:hypothetical protein
MMPPGGAWRPCLDSYRPDGLPTVDETGRVRCPPTSVLLGPFEAVAYIDAEALYVPGVTRVPP